MPKRRDEREARIIRTSIVGIGANVALAAIKAIIGFVTASIAITLDAVNNLSDALSSLITIVGTKLAHRDPDKKHPLGYGRIEYLTSSIISMIVLYAGITAFIDSVQKIIDPEVASYTPLTLVFIAIAVVVKIFLGRYVKATGVATHSEALEASGSDALFDAILSTSTLAAALIYICSGVSLEAWVGAIISCFIVKAGIDMLRDALAEILGERISPETAEQVKKLVAQDPDVHGAYDLLLHSYGPELLVGDIHVEVADTLTAQEIDSMTRRIQEQVYNTFDQKIILATVGIYAQNSSSQSKDAKDTITKIAASEPHVIQTHGFYIDRDKQYINLDIVVDFEANDRVAIRDSVVKKIKQAYPAYRVHVTLDADVAD